MHHGGAIMKSNNPVNNQSDNGGNEKYGAQQHKQGERQQDTQIDQGNMNQSGSQSGSEQQGQPGQRQSNDLAGGLPRSPGAGKLAADDDMDDDTGLSNRGNRQSAEDIDEGSRQSRQSNVGRRDDGTPD
jgi:hypothetical protein